MMLQRILLGLCLVALLPVGAQAQLQNIDDIQVYDDAGSPNSPLNGLAVEVRGVITTEKGTYNSGTHYIQDPTGGINFFDSTAPVFAIGDSISVTGVVGSFSGEINVSPPFTYQFYNSVTPPAPLALTVLEAIDNDNSGTLNSADFEIMGTLVSVTGNVAFLPGVEAPPWPAGTAQGTFGLHNGAGDTLQIFVDRTTGIDPTGIGENELYQVIGPMSVFSGRLQVKPRFQADLIENPGDPFPSVANITPDPWSPDPLEAVIVSADISDNNSVTSATLYYAYGGSGSFTSVAMVDDGFGNYSATIPGTAMSSIEYYIEAVDNAAQTTTVPGDAPTTTLGVAVGLTSIVTIQSTLAPDMDASALVGQIVNIEGIVTGAPGEVQTGGLSNYVVEEEQGGQWSAMFIFEGSGSNIFLRGDKIRISGTVSEFSGITEVLPQRGDAVELVSVGNPLPRVSYVATQNLFDSEAYESVLVGTFLSTVCDTTLAGAEWGVVDAQGDSCLYVDPAPGVSHIATLGEQMYVTGFLDTRFGRNEIVPIDDLHVVLLSSVGTTGVPGKAHVAIDQIRPNPFNPRTTISFTLPERGFTELAIFDARGRRVSTLVSGELDPGLQSIEWNGRDGAGVSVGSGVYYARLRFGTQSLAVEKMTLVK